MASPFETALKRLLRVRTKNLASFNNGAGVRVHEPSLVMAGLVPAIDAFCYTMPAAHGPTVAGGAVGG